MNEEPKWIGQFLPEDCQEINSLRAKQVDSIEKGNASTYSDLCTDDILLMLQGNDLVIGKSDFYQCELNLFQKIKFESIKQTPIRIERQDKLAVEIGRQELVTAASIESPQDYPRYRKYCHVMRKTAQGWRFAILMSNSSE